MNRCIFCGALSQYGRRLCGPCFDTVPSSLRTALVNAKDAVRVVEIRCCDYLAESKKGDAEAAERRNQP